MLFETAVSPISAISQRIPKPAFDAGIREPVPYQLFEPQTQSDRLLYAVLLELQKIVTKLDALNSKADVALAPVSFEIPAEEMPDSAYTSLREIAPTKGKSK